MNYRVVDKETYYRKGVFRHFTEDCKCSTSMTARLDVTELAACSKRTETKFYLNFLYLLSKVLNSREDYRMGYLWQTDELICYDVIHPMQYVFHEDTETCTPVYTEYDPDYEKFYAAALRDLEAAKQTREIFARCGESSQLVRRVVYPVALLRFPASGAARRLSVLRADRQLG